MKKNYHFGNTTKILIIEDEKILAEMYKEKFLQAGFNVDLAVSAEEGLLFLERAKPDFILLDILLPDMDGIQFLRHLRSTKEYAGIPVVAFSNYDDPKIKKEAIQLGAKEYLLKTQFTPRQLIERINNFL